MITVQEMFEGLRSGLWDRAWREDFRQEIAALSDDELVTVLQEEEARPMPIASLPHPKRLSFAVLTLQWLSAYRAVGLPEDARLLEVCAGGSPPALIALYLHTQNRGRYTGINLNRPLTAQFKDEVAHLPVEAEIIEENAIRVGERFQPGSLNAVAFHHAVNDILQTAVAEPRGIDTRTVDWWPHEMTMISWLAEVAGGGRWEKGKPELLACIKAALAVTEPGGWLIFDHFTWDGHRKNPEFPARLFHDMIPLTRRWMQESGLPCQEVVFEGFDPQWWMFLQKER
ncbi:MAG: hypothetical protein IT210_09895 [Armatimonadetes bacterium]|nr:hypothetical protein [Armatimonadota bacterium]